MPEITLKAIEQLLDTKLEPINTKLAAVEEILGHHTAVLDSHTSVLNNHTSILDSHTSVLNNHTSVLDNHTSVLDALSRDVKTLLDDKTVTAHRIERIEHWAQVVGDKLGIKLEV